LIIVAGIRRFSEQALRFSESLIVFRELLFFVILGEAKNRGVKDAVIHDATLEEITPHKTRREILHFVQDDTKQEVAS
jgi:hypothetical protein